jgi:tetratricopeptide (TPR) repeat protein
MKPYESACWTTRAANVVFALSAAVCLPVLLLDTNWQALGLLELSKSVAAFPSTAKCLIFTAAWDLSAAGVFTLLFVTYRLSRNLRALDVDGLVYSPVSAVLGFVVPVLNLWRPGQVMSEIAKASSSVIGPAERTAWQTIESKPAVKYWGYAWSLVLIAALFQFSYWVVLDSLGLANASWARSVGSLRWICIQIVYAYFLTLSIYVISFVQKEQDLKWTKIAEAKGDSAGSRAASSLAPEPDWLLVSLIVLALGGLGADLYVMSSQDRRAAFAGCFLGAGANVVRNVLGPNHPLEAALLSELADRYKSCGKLLEAAKNFEAAGRIFESSTAPDIKRAAYDYLQAGLCYFRLHDLRQAEPALKRALALSEKLPGMNDSQLGYLLTHVANALFNQRKFAEAEPFYQRALTGRRTAKNFNGPSLEVCRSNLLNNYRSERKNSDAEALLKEAIADHEKELATAGMAAGKVVVLADDITALGDIQAESGKYKEAEASFKKALDLREKHHDSTSGGLAWNLMDLGWVYQKQGNYSLSEQFIKQAITIDAQIRSGYLPGDYAALATLYDKQKRYAEADQLYGRAEDLMRQDRQMVGFGTPIFAGRIHRLLTQIPADKAVQQFAWASDYVSEAVDRSPTWSRQLVILDLRPVIGDFRSHPASSSHQADESNASIHGAQMPTDLGIVVLEEQLGTILSKLSRAEAVKNFGWCEKFLPLKGKQSVRESLPATVIPGTTLHPLSVQELIPKRIIIIDTAEYERLKKACGLTAADEKRIGIQKAQEILRHSN